MPASTSKEVAPSHAWRIWLLVMLVAVGIRGGALWAQRQQLDADPDAYRQIAEARRKTGVYTLDLPEDAPLPSAPMRPTAFRPPLYPWLLAAVALDGEVTRTAVMGLHFFLGMATVACVYRLGQLWGLGHAAAIAALLVAADPILLKQSSVVMTETLATFLAVMCLWLLTRYDVTRTSTNLALACACIGLATLCRATFLPWLGFVWLIVAMEKRSLQQRVRRLAIVPLLALAVLLPWGARNQFQLGQPILTTTNGGFALWIANNDDFYDYLASGSDIAWQADPQHRPERLLATSKNDFDLHPEIRRSQAETAAARETIARRPAMFIYASIVRLGYMWSPLPQKTQISESTYRVLARYLVAMWYVGVYGMALVGAWKMRKHLCSRPWVWGVTLCIAFTAIHMVYWSNLRMRAPLMPVVALLAAAGCNAAISRPAPTLRR